MYEKHATIADFSLICQYFSEGIGAMFESHIYTELTKKVANLQQNVFELCTFCIT